MQCNFKKNLISCCMWKEYTGVTQRANKKNKIKKEEKKKILWNIFHSIFLKQQQGEKAIILSWKIDLKQAVAVEGWENAVEHQASKETRQHFWNSKQIGSTYNWRVLPRAFLLLASGLLIPGSAAHSPLPCAGQTWHSGKPDSDLLTFRESP